jgi:uncharacterized membrane protein
MMSVRHIFRSIALLAGMAMLFIGLSTPATAHKEHKKKKPVAAQVVQPGEQPSEPMATQGGPTAMHGQMGELMEHQDEDRSTMTFMERLMDWLGRTHPVIVHFPIAFFPAALFTAIVGRRRPAFEAPVRFLVITGGIIAPVAAVLGWLDAMGADPDRLLTVHRWLGTAVGIGALGLAVWAWRKPEQDRSVGMIVALTVITAAIIVQGWFGGAMVHGIDHMNW